MSASTLKRLDPTQVELEISISPDEFDAAQEAAFRELSRNAKIPGFRPGKIPRKLFESQYGTAAIVDRALENVVPKAYAAAVEEHHIEPLERPQMELLPVGEEAERSPVRVKAVVAVRPEIVPKDYTGVKISPVKETADDEDVDRALDSMRREAASLVPVSRPVAMGDVATLDYEGKIDGVAFEGGSAQNEPTEIAPDRFIPGFVEGIVGMNAGETKDVVADFPAEYGNAELAGKQAIFTVTVHEVKEPELPALDDEFAARVSRQGTLLELKIDIRKRLDEMARDRARGQMSQELLEKIVAANEVPVPPVLVEREIGSLVEDAQRYVARGGIEWASYLAESGKTEESLRDEFRGEAERRVRSTLLVEAIARAESIEATREEVAQELGALAARYGQPPEKIVEVLRGDLSSVVDGIVRTKTLDWLIDHAEREGAPQPAAD